MAEELSYDAVEHRTEALLEEWGGCQRRTPSAMPKGWPGTTVESKLMDEYGRKTKGDQRRRWAWRHNKGKTRTQGRLHNVHVLAPDRNDTESRGGTRPPQQWPQAVQDVDRVIAGIRCGRRLRWRGAPGTRWIGESTAGAGISRAGY